MDEPLRDRLRAARPGGLTSPDRSPRPTAKRPPTGTSPKTKAWTRRKARERQETHGPGNRQDHYQRPADQKANVRIHAVDRG